jgi:hypothetical protein
VWNISTHKSPTTPSACAIDWREVPRLALERGREVARQARPGEHLALVVVARRRVDGGLAVRPARDQHREFCRQVQRFLDHARASPTAFHAEPASAAPSRRAWPRPS